MSKEMKKKSRVFIFADSHFNHDKIRKYCNRPFKNIDLMNKTLIKNWNSLINEKDLVIILGDFILDYGGSKSVKDILKQLNKSTRILVKGNHDRKTYSYYRDNGIDFVCERFEWKYAGKKILFIHDPNKVRKTEYKYYDLVIHGHTHQNDFTKYNSRSKIHFINMSCDKTNYRPVFLNSITSKFFKKNIRKSRKKEERNLLLEAQNNSRRGKLNA